MHQKAPSQRQACGCVVSRDIGMYDSCLLGRAYCYATSNLARAWANHAQHHPDSPLLIGWHETSVESATAIAAIRSHHLIAKQEYLDRMTRLQQ